jgi:hypothetical protein
MWSTELWLLITERSRGELFESFESKEQAERHGLELCKEWIDKQNNTKRETQKRAAIR